MAVKVTIKGGGQRLLPTTVEVDDRLQEALQGYVETSSFEEHKKEVASTTAPGHIKLSSEAAKDLGEVALSGESKDAAPADHVHKLPTAEQVGAAPATHVSEQAASGSLGHVKLAESIDDVDGASVLPASKVKSEIEKVEQAIQDAFTEVTSGIKFENSYYFAKTQSATDIKDPANIPSALATTLGLTHVMDITLVDLSDGKCDVYTASTSASDWGSPESKTSLGEFPVNGSQVGVSGFFLDLSQGQFPGYAIYSETKQKWDYYPDRVLSMDNQTLVRDESGKYRIADYAPGTKDADTADFTGAESKQGYFDWIQSFYRKIRGLHSADSTMKASIEKKIDQAAEEGAYVSNGESTTIEKVSAAGEASSIAKRDADGSLYVSETQKEENGAVINYKYLTEKLSEEDKKIEDAVNKFAFEEVVLADDDWTTDPE